MSDWETIYGPEKETDKVDLSSSDLVEAAGEKDLKPLSSNSGRRLMGTSSFAMENRDPNQLNGHCQVMFDDIIGEPEGSRSPECCWNTSIKCYDGTRNCCYVFLVVMFAPFIAFFNGLAFACITFQQVWCVGPCLRQWKINLATFRKFWWGLLLACCGPCSEAFGLYFSKIKVRYQKLPEGDDADAKIADEYYNI